MGWRWWQDETETGIWARPAKFEEQKEPEDIPPYGSEWNIGWRWHVLLGGAVLLLIVWIVTFGTLIGVM